MEKLSTQPYKGSRDFYPEDMKIRQYIFSIWRDVCKSYGYEEYDGPFLESFDLYAAKSGEEIVNEQLYSFEDKGGRKVAIRPEMTPTLARMVAAKYKILPRPIRWFSIPNLWRYENPQKGRLREHFQLNVDIFGVEGMEADFEILSIGIDIMKRSGAKAGMFEIRVGNRRLIEDVYSHFGIDKNQFNPINKAIDKIKKISTQEFRKLLTENAKLNEKQISDIADFLENPTPLLEKLSSTSLGAKEVKNLLQLAKENGKEEFIKFDPTIMRGFDYYTGNVFEQFDLNPENNRAMYGGGRYDDLVTLFTGDTLSGIGLGMGDVTFRNFLETWELLPQLESDVEYFVTLWPSDDLRYRKASLNMAEKLRSLGKNVECWIEKNVKMDKQLKYADRKGIKKVLIIGEEELNQNTIVIKDMNAASQKSLPVEEFLSM